MDSQAVLIRIHVGVSGVRNDKAQAVWRERAVQQMMRRTSVLGSRLGFRVAERPHHIFFESGSCTVIRNSGAWPKAPRIVRELLSGCRLNERITSHRPGQGGPAPEKHAPVKQTVTGNWFQMVL